MLDYPRLHQHVALGSAECAHRVRLDNILKLDASKDEINTGCVSNPSELSKQQAARF